MSYYDEVYLKRLNRYGLDYQSRIQGQRERNFDDYLLKTLYRVDFMYHDKLQPGSLERYKQDYTETQAYLLTKIDLKIPNGTVLDLIGQDGFKRPWMVWWLEQIQSSGYNRYIVLKMTHIMTWMADNRFITQLGYFSGPGAKTIKDTVKSSTGKTLYTENDNLHMFITPYNPTLVKETYFEVTEGGTNQAFIVTDVDINSTPGITYASVDPTLLRSHEGPPLKEDVDPEDENRDTDFYWLEGGK